MQATGSTDKWVGLIGDKDFFEKNKNLKRPMSPHLTIYKPQLTSMLSITHRGTGIALTGVMSIAGIALGFGGEPFAYYMDIIRELPAPVIFLGKLGLAFPFTYHTTNGIRHLMWDTVKGLDIASVYKSGWTTLGISSAAAVGLALL